MTSGPEDLNILLSPAVFDPPMRLVLPSSWVGHIPFAFWIVEMLRPKLLVELGTHTGNSYSASCQAIRRTNSSCTAFAVDTWKGDKHSGLYGEEIFEDFSKFNDRNFGSFSKLIRSTFDDALDHFSNGFVDLLHIDGLHNYESVKHDFETWLPKISDRGVALFHDINAREKDFGVWKYWEELTETYKGFRFDHCNGLVDRI